VNGVFGAVADGLTSAGSPVKQTGHYRIATRFGDEVVLLTMTISSTWCRRKPTVQIQNPWRDYRATNEEVPVGGRPRMTSASRRRLHHQWRRLAVDKLRGRCRHRPRLCCGWKRCSRSASRRIAAAGSGDLVSYYAQARDQQQRAPTCS
jgi:hypothetical protein